MHRVHVARAVGIQAPTCCSPFESSIGSRCPRSVREKRRGGACADHIIAIVQALLAAMHVGVDVSVLRELVCVVVDGVGVSGGHGGRLCCCCDSCGSVGRTIGPLEDAPKSFVFGPSAAATGLYIAQLPAYQIPHK